MNKKSHWKLRREVSRGGRVPRGWRMAWYEPRRRVGIYYLWPLHWIVRVSREVAHRARIALESPALERAEVFQMQRIHREQQRLADEYARGYMKGWRECFDVCLDSVEQELADADDAWKIGALLVSPPGEPRKEN